MHHMWQSSRYVCTATTMPHLSPTDSMPYRHGDVAFAHPCYPLPTFVRSRTKCAVCGICPPVSAYVRAMGVMSDIYLMPLIGCEGCLYTTCSHIRLHSMPRRTSHCIAPHHPLCSAMPPHQHTSPSVCPYRRLRPPTCPYRLRCTTYAPLKL